MYEIVKKNKEYKLLYNTNSDDCQEGKMQDDLRIKDSGGLELSQEGDNCLDFGSDCQVVVM